MHAIMDAYDTETVYQTQRVLGRAFGLCVPDLKGDLSQIWWALLREGADNNYM